MKILINDNRYEKNRNFKGSKFIGVWKYLIDFEKVYFQRSILK